ncbi:MAG: hypothetical protein KGI28_06455 [Thaumarchaeota archaeon]|nr:hypothetical protein [Nitrososphaerota archaeon]
MVGWKFWKDREESDNYLTGVVRRIENRGLHNFLQVIAEPHNPKGYNIIEATQEKPNKNILINGVARGGKTSLGEYFCLKLPYHKIVLSFKKFQNDNRDFDIGYHWIDVSQYFPNLFADGRSFCEAFRCAYFSDLSSRGLMIDTILSKVYEVMDLKPKNFEDFFKALDRVSRSGQWDANITNIVKSKVKKLQIEGAKHGSIDFRQGNIVLDLGNLPDDEIKTFVAELFLRQINRIEEEEQNKDKLYIIIDEAWHVLASRQQRSVIGTMLLQGAYYIHLIIITQNYTHLDEDYRGHFGSHYCFRNTNDKDLKAIESGYGAFVRDGVRQLEDFCYTDLRYQHGDNLLPYWILNIEKLERLKEKARTLKVEEKQNHETENVSHTDFVSDGNNVWKGEEQVVADKIGRDDLKMKIVNVLEKNCLYGYEIAKRIGLNSKEAVNIRQPLRELARAGMVKEIQIRLRNKDVTYYYLSNGESSHDLMMEETEKEIIKAGWRIINKARHGVAEPDFVIEEEIKGKGENRVGELERRKEAQASGNPDYKIVECETGSKKSLGEFDLRVSNYDKPVLIVVPNEEQKTRYEYLPCVNSGKAKVCLIPEIKEVLKKW